ncbi:RNA polymerase sigma factor [Alishewanella longhuensis]
MPNANLSAPLTMPLPLEQQLQPDVTAAIAGDKQAFGRLIRRCQNSVSSIALAIVKDLDASEEVCQQVFIAAWQQVGSLQNPASFLPWVRQITRYRAYSYLREQRDAKTSAVLTLKPCWRLLPATATRPTNYCAASRLR